MSRADKTLSKIIYEITLDDSNSKVVQLKVTTLCAQRFPGKPLNPKTAFTTDPHIAFVATYRISQRNEVERFGVPGPAVKMLK